MRGCRVVDRRRALGSGSSQARFGSSLALVVLAVLAVPSVRAAAQDAPATPPPSAREGRIDHVPGRAHVVWLNDGDRLDAGTCGLEGASAKADTVLRLLDPSGREVVANDDGCFGSYGSRLAHHVPRGGAGAYTLVADCYRGGSCGGVIAYRVEARGVPAESSGVRLSFHARGLLAVDNAGGGGLADLTVEVRTLAPLVLRLEAGPVGLAGGVHGGLLGGAAQLTLLVDWDWMAIGAGLGVGVLGRRQPGVPDQEALLAGLRARLGDLTGFHVAGELRGAVVADAIRTHSLRVEARLPLDGVDLVLRGAGGDEGLALAELAAVVWLDRAPNRPRLGLSLSAGAGGVFYEPLCRFAEPCGRPRWYAGPTVGAGLEWRP